MNKSETIKAVGMTALVGILLAVVIYQFFSLNSEAFTRPPQKIELMAGDGYYERRKERNIESMNQSYAESMTLGHAYLDEDYLDQAMNHFFTAKTLFPTRMGPRKNLCYSYMVLCQQDYRWCDQAQREIYYAMKYVTDQDKETKDYILLLADLVQMDTILTMDEADAMSAIF